MKLILATILAWLTATGHAVDETRYVTIQPTFVTNFGYSESGRLKYLKADVAVRVSSLEAETALKYHFPMIRDSLVLLFSRQDQATVSSGDGREQLRQEALAELRALMEAEEGDPFIEDLVFSNFIVQH